MLQCSIHEHDREAAPIIGAAVCCPCLVSPVLSWLMIPGFKRMLFAPARVPARFKAEYSSAMALRPSQIRATAVDGALMVPSVMRLHYRDLKGSSGNIRIGLRAIVWFPDSRCLKGLLCRLDD